jgi:hypothetical protein
MEKKCMNAKKIGSILGLGLVLIAMLSMFAMPASALSSVSYSRGTGCSHGSFYVHVVGYYNDGTPDTFVSGSAYPVYSGYTLDSYPPPTITSSIVYADGVGVCNTCGLHIEATAWVSPLTYPLHQGGSVSTW